MKEILKQAKELPHCLIGKEITMEDIIAVWRAVGKFVRCNLERQKVIQHVSKNRMLVSYFLYIRMRARKLLMIRTPFAMIYKMK
ncbi:hypothetical protein HNY73_013552 [Argiope bruennichi]|uniref:Uncharacterized protein n=1 Tax=Argiope bruennichi TaxID=94029 RepID=A0A8T0F0N3_ARGBR|nr:hypothetical protein HNY73_013552 [Argiope bruennichi]